MLELAVVVVLPLGQCTTVWLSPRTQIRLTYPVSPHPNARCELARRFLGHGSLQCEVNSIPMSPPHPLRLLVYSVASGLPLLASGLLEWLMGMEAPVMGLSAAAVTSAASQALHPVADAAVGTGTGSSTHLTALSALFSRVLVRAAAATERAVAASLSVAGTVSASGTDGEGENLYPAVLDSAAIVPGLVPPQSPGLLASGYEPLPLTPPISGQSFSSNSFTLESRLESFTDGAQRSSLLGLGLLHLAVRRGRAWTKSRGVALSVMAFVAARITCSMRIRPNLFPSQHALNPHRTPLTGLRLIRVQVASGSSGMVLAALDWADMYGRPWSLDEQAGPRRTSPLHLAAALADGGEISRLLLSLSGTGPHGGQWHDAWFMLRDGQGRTPADIAAANSDPGMAGVNHFCMHGEELPDAEEVGGHGGDAGVTVGGLHRGDAVGDASTTAGPAKLRDAPTTPSLLPMEVQESAGQQQQLGHVGSPLLLVGGLMLALALALMLLSGAWRRE